jgi:hypothetical protein
VVAQLGLVLDCHDPEALATFWSQALGYDLIGGAGSYVLLLPPSGEKGAQFLLQRVPEPKQTKNRMHFDIHVGDIEAEASTAPQATRASQRMQSAQPRTLST